MFTNATGIEMQTLSGGTFTMGSSNDKASIYFISLPHDVTLSSFSLAKYEVTFQQWTEVYTWATNNGYSFDPNISYPYNGAAGYSPFGDPNKNPVTSVNWNNAVKWCNALSQKESKKP